MAWDVDVCGGSIRRSRDNMSLEADKALEERGRHLRTWLLGTLQLNSRSLCRPTWRFLRASSLQAASVQIVRHRPLDGRVMRHPVEGDW